jgi:cytochrome c oxidase subunit 3
MLAETEKRRRSATTGMLAGLAATTMLFAALLSAYVVRRGISDSWTRLELPGTLYISLVPGVAVWLMVESARRRSDGSTAGLLICAAAMAMLFSVMHVRAWPEYAFVGIPAGDFLFVISALLVTCAVSGVPALIACALRGHRPASIVYYWLYLNALWAFVLAFFHVVP